MRYDKTASKGDVNAQLVVVIRNRAALLLDYCVYEGDVLKSAYAVNGEDGAYKIEFGDGVLTYPAFPSSVLATISTIDWSIIKVPDDHIGDYNSILSNVDELIKKGEIVV